jgi:hypothetical protein
MWELDDYEDKWIPVDPDTGERHSCSRRPRREPDPVECQYCGDDIIFKKRLGKDGVTKWLVYDADTNMIHDCPERREEWLAEQENRKVRSGPVQEWLRNPRVLGL